MQSQKRRAFVFITNIPEFLLKPLQTNTHRETRDPRYERLRRLLADHTAGIMAVMHLETSGYALALYASEEEAVAACQTTIVPESPERDYPPLTMRIIEKEKPLPPEAVYTPNITIEGECVAKNDLADTRGLERVYRGQRIARWCPYTIKHEDCSYGVSCDRIHLKAYQRTVRKRPRPRDDDLDDSPLSSADMRRVQSTVLDKRQTQAHMAPMPTVATAGRTTSANASPLLALPTVYVPVTVNELEEALSSVTTPGSSSGDCGAAATKLIERIETSLAAYKELDTSHWSADWATKGPFFMKLSCPGGAPWNWALYDDGGDPPTTAKPVEGGLARLRRLCPFPANGVATPLQRDLLEQKLLYCLNQLNRFTTVAEGVRALSCVYAHGLRDALAEYRTAMDDVSRAQRGRRTASKGEDEGEDGDRIADGASIAPSLSICVQPWLYLPTAGCEVTAFTEIGGSRLRGVVQRHGSLRLMTSAALLHTPVPSSTATTATTQALAQLDRFAIPENEVDMEAEKLMSTELTDFNRHFMAAVAEWQHRVKAQSSANALPATAPWCGRFALALSPPHHESDANAEDEPVTIRGVVLLSLSDSQRAVEECVLFSFLKPSVEAGAADTSAPDVLQVGWNTQKHPYIPLFSIDQLGLLRTTDRT